MTRIPPRAWIMLALGIAAQAAGTLLVSAPVFLIPLLHLDRGLPLAQAGLLSAAPTVGMVLTLIAWGHLADRRGERGVIAGGLLLAALLALAAAVTSDLIGLGVALLAGGAAAASTNAASGRVVVGWFPRDRRGLAMGIRQMAQPLGVAAAAALVPALAGSAGIPATFLVIAAALAIIAAACAAGIRNPPRAAASGPERPAVNPYRASGFLARIHAVSLLLVVPQFAVSTFGMVFLISALGWGQDAAAALVAISQFVGALGRIVVGVLSDRVGSRVRVLRGVAVSAVVVMLALAMSGAFAWAAVGGVIIVIAAVVTVADNGLAYTSVAEAAGSSWVGKALGVQNTGQFIAASLVGPGIGALITATGFAGAFALVALVPLIAVPLVPRRDVHRE
jgi:MFS family permease